jgi:hypothetical protein
MPKHESHFTQIARQILGITSPTWAIFQWECVDKTTLNRKRGVMVTGSETTPFKCGPRKGRMKFVGPESRCVILPEHEAEWRVRFEQETGDCHECLGEGKLVRSAGVDGVTYRPCLRCGGKGLRPTTTTETTHV